MWYRTISRCLVICLVFIAFAFAQKKGEEPNKGTEPEKQTEIEKEKEPDKNNEVGKGEEPNKGNEPNKENEKNKDEKEPNKNTEGGKNNTTVNNGNGNITIRFMPPWTNTSAILVQDGKETIMTAVKNYCGWFEAKTNAPSGQFEVVFKQTIGNSYIANSGLIKESFPSGDEISLDSVSQLSSTIWIIGNANSSPDIYSTYPNRLGECPVKTLPVMMFDWLHGSGLDSENAKTEGVSADFGSGGCAKHTTGMVQKKLGSNGVPVSASNFPSDCKLSTHIDSWFLPEVLATKNGKKYTNATCRDLTLNMTDDGFWLGQENKKSAGGGMFFLDDFEYLDEERTIKNKYYDRLQGSGGIHNFGFTMKIQAKFEYVPGQYFEFYGDDDVWVFINNELVVDIGGQHQEVNGSVDLDTLGLTPGKTYPFHIFYAERHTVESNFMMRTSIDLQTDASIFLTDTRSTKTIKNYDVWQIIKQDALSCDFDNKNASAVDTSEGPSNYHLIGGKLGEEGVDLEPAGTFYEGIIIDKSYTKFSVDTAKIAENYALAPGSYYIEVSLKSNPTQKTGVWFTIPSYKMPTIVYTDSTWEEIGDNINSSVLNWSEWAYEPQKVYVKLKEDWAQVNDYNRILTLYSDDPNVKFLDKDGKPISKISLDDDGHAWFYVVGNGDIDDANITVGGQVNNPAKLTHVNFVEPPIPHVKNATIYDRNGDGRGDSLYIIFDKNFGGDSKLNAIQVTFGEALPEQSIKNFTGNTLELVSGNCKNNEPCGFGNMQFTGSSYGIYTGTMAMRVSYTNGGKTNDFNIFDEKVNDGIGAIIKTANKKIEEGKNILTLTFSEAINDSTKKYYANMFQFKCTRGDVDKDPVSPNSYSSENGNTMSLIYVGNSSNQVIPSVGDRVRFTPGKKSSKVAVDYSKNKPHIDNPWVIITGDQDMKITSAGLITLNSDNPIVKSDSATVPTLITDLNIEAKEIAKENGVQGHLIDFDISTLVANQTKQEIASLEQFIANTMSSNGKLDTTITYISKSEATKSLFSEIKSGVISEGYGLSTELIDAIIAGKVTASNFENSDYVSNEESLTIKAMIQSKIESSKKVVVSSTQSDYPDMQSVFDGIKNGEFSLDVLEDAKISNRVVKAIKEGKLTLNNIDDYRNGDKTLVKSSQVKLIYKTHYYSHLGDYVNGDNGTIGCSDKVYKKDSSKDNCITNGGKIFLAWNMRSKSGKLVGTGVYVARLEFKITMDGQIIKEQVRDFLWGVRRGKENGITLDLKGKSKK